MSHDDARQQPGWKPLGSGSGAASAEYGSATYDRQVIRLVVAARRVFDLGYADEEFRELDEALEAFSPLVPYDPK